MPDSHRQSAPRSRIADSPRSYWGSVGGHTALARAAGAALWQGMATDPGSAALTGANRLPLPCLGRAIIRLATQGDRGAAVANRFARRAASRHLVGYNPEPLVEGIDTLYHDSVTRREAMEIGEAWSAMLSAGECTILADASGNILPGARARLVALTRGERQSDLWRGRRGAAGLLRYLAEAKVRRGGIARP